VLDKSDNIEEALRLGCETYAGDYNPVAVLILKATLEYPQKYGRPFEGMPDRIVPDDHLSDGPDSQQATLFAESEIEYLKSGIHNPLLEAVTKWSDWVLEEARKELECFYPPRPRRLDPRGLYLGADHSLPEPGLRRRDPPDAPVLVGKEGQKESGPLSRDHGRTSGFPHRG
jgi:putative DNA methylase